VTPALLAAASTTQPAWTPPAWLPAPQHWPGQVDLITWCQDMGPGTAAVLLVLGIVYLVLGIYLYRALVTLNAAMVGACAGAWIGEHFDATVPCLIIGLVLAAGLTWLLMKYAVAVMGGVYGGLLGAALWQTLGLDPNCTWAGGAIGLVGFGLLSFILFRGSIMMYTSLQGSVMLVFGLLGMILEYQELAPTVLASLKDQPYALPMAIFIPALVGLIFQQTRYPQPAAPAPEKK
jgi:hypothetical protein